MTNAEQIEGLLVLLVKLDSARDQMTGTDIASVMERTRLDHEIERTRREIRRLENESK